MAEAGRPIEQEVGVVLVQHSTSSVGAPRTVTVMVALLIKLIGGYLAVLMAVTQGIG